MLLSEVLFALFLAGLWLYCLTDTALTPAVPGWPKRAWVAFIAATFAIGAIARHPPTRSIQAERPVQAAGPKGPDDDAEFPSHLHRLIRGE